MNDTKTISTPPQPVVDSYTNGFGYWFRAVTLARREEREQAQRDAEALATDASHT
jgi:hypothetical protein